MTLKKTVLTVGIAFVALAGSAAAAFAAPAYATNNVNVRSGPGGGFPVVDNLRRGERVEIDQCRGTWCLVYGNSTEGWVSANYLGDSGRAVRPTRPANVDIGINFGGGPRYGGWDHGPRRGGWDRPRHDDWDHGPRRGFDGPRGGGGIGFYFGN